MSGRLEGKVAVVTGAGRGIGRAEAWLLASEGAKVVVNDIGTSADGIGTDRATADQLVLEIQRNKGQAVANYDSVATSEGADRLIKAAVDTFGRIDILVNNATFFRNGLLYEMSDEDWDLVLKVQLYGHFYCSRAACRLFKEQGSGRIITTGSRAAFNGDEIEPNYCAAKGGIISLTRNIAVTMGKYGVTCNCICPLAATRTSYHPSIKNAWEKKGILQQKLLEYEKAPPERVAPLVVYLVSEQAANINGRVFFVGGNVIQLYPEPSPVKTIYREGGWSVDALAEIVPSTLADGA